MCVADADSLGLSMGLEFGLTNWTLACDKVHVKIPRGFLAERIFRGFSFLEPPDVFADFVAGFFLPVWWEKVTRKILQENSRQNPPKFTQQNPRA